MGQGHIVSPSSIFFFLSLQLVSKTHQSKEVSLVVILIQMVLVKKNNFPYTMHINTEKVTRGSFNSFDIKMHVSNIACRVYVSHVCNYITPGEAYRLYFMSCLSCILSPPTLSGVSCGDRAVPQLDMFVCEGEHS